MQMGPGRVLWALGLWPAACRGLSPSAPAAGPAAEAAGGTAVAHHRARPRARPQRQHPGLSLCLVPHSVLQLRAGDCGEVGRRDGRALSVVKGKAREEHFWIILTRSQADLGATAEASGRGCPLNSMPGSQCLLRPVPDSCLRDTRKTSLELEGQ